jgi:hypothetical protein
MTLNNPDENEQDDVPLEGAAALQLYLSTILENVDALDRHVAVLREAFVNWERHVDELDSLRKLKE